MPIGSKIIGQVDIDLITSNVCLQYQCVILGEIPVWCQVGQTYKYMLSTILILGFHIFSRKQTSNNTGYLTLVIWLVFAVLERYLVVFPDIK